MRDRNASTSAPAPWLDNDDDGENKDYIKSAEMRFYVFLLVTGGCPVANTHKGYTAQSTSVRILVYISVKGILFLITKPTRCTNFSNLFLE